MENNNISPQFGNMMININIGNINGKVQHTSYMQKYYISLY